MGLLGTVAAGVAGVLITQRRSDRREDNAWQRERRRERERWAREDEARTFEHRREAYVEFYESLKTMARLAYDHGFGFTGEPALPQDWHAATFQKLQRLSIYATPLVARAASAAYGAAWQWGHYAPYDNPDDDVFHERQEAYDAAEIEVLQSIRQDLSIGGGELTGVP
jgi:hypothetical protein